MELDFGAGKNSKQQEGEAGTTTKTRSSQYLFVTMMQYGMVCLRRVSYNLLSSAIEKTGHFDTNPKFVHLSNFDTFLDSCCFKSKTKC